MKLKNKLFGIIVSILFILSIVSQSVVYAEAMPKERWFGIIPLMKNDTPNLGYAILNPGNGGDGDQIWNIVEYDSATADEFKNPNIYCVKAKVGFVQRDYNGNRRAAYNVSYDMKTQRDQIKNVRGDVLKEIVEGTIPYKDGSINRYDALLAVLDMLYLPGESTQAEKEVLMKNIIIDAIKKGYASSWIDEENPMKYPLTDDDINAMQQAVIWYFTNYGEDHFDQTTTSLDNEWIFYSTDGNTTTGAGYTGFNNYSEARSYEAKWLYRYMIEQAKEKASQYTNASQTAGSPIRVDTTNADLKTEEQEENYIVGPIHMTQLNPKPYEIGFTVKNGENEITNYQLLDENKQKVASGKTVKDLVGTDFYLSLPKNQAEALSIDIVVQYNDTTMTLYASETNTEQPLVEVHKTNQTEATKLEITREKPFDLSLRKYITKVNRTQVNVSRNPKIETEKLNTQENGQTITTAEYKHKKDPVPVETGNIVTYEMTIYNEGEKAGRATKVVDQLPTGLKFDKIVSGNFELENYNEETNTLTLKRKADNNTNLEGYTQGKTELDAETIEIECMVEAQADTQKQKILTNVAWIAEAIDEEGKKVDRDSQPETKPEVNKDNMEDYTGNNNKEELADPENYYKGQQDDDDFEKLVLAPTPKGNFDLSLRKFIVAVSKDDKIEDSEYLKNEDGTYKRAPIVDTSKLNTTGEDGKQITTAIYKHTKEPVLVQPNNRIVYMLRVYNEGDIDGYAGEIKDHLPPYLEFVEGEFNEQYGWKVSEDGRCVTTKYLEDKKIAAAVYQAGGITEEGPVDGFQPYTLDYQEVPIMCKIKDNVKAGEKVTNIAEITQYLDENKESVTDRDSQENNVELPEDKDLPGYKDNETGDYIPGQQDDDDFEKVIVKTFDLALRKWVTQAIVIENGQQTITQTGHNPYDDPEEVVKVELHRKKLNQVTVKFRYSIRVINEGEIEGYAKEVKDYVPEGLKFEASDNPGWTDEGNNVISTKLLENTLLQPGEYADVEVVLTWINSESNMGVMNNIAEISKDYNEYGVPDIDSTPDNKKIGEDDIDDAPVMLSISTGQIRIYFTLGFMILITIASGVVLIKRFVL